MHSLGFCPNKYKVAIANFFFGEEQGTTHEEEK